MNGIILEDEKRIRDSSNFNEVSNLVDGLIKKIIFGYSPQETTKWRILEILSGISFTKDLFPEDLFCVINQENKEMLESVHKVGSFGNVSLDFVFLRYNLEFGCQVFNYIIQFIETSQLFGSFINIFEDEILKSYQYRDCQYIIFPFLGDDECCGRFSFNSTKLLF